MHRLTIQYESPADVELFDAEYFETHVPMCWSLPGLRSASFSKPQTLASGESPYLVAELDFDDAQALTEALGSPEMSALARHAATLPATRSMFRGDVLFLIARTASPARP